MVDPVAAAQPAARSKDLMRAMKEAAQGMRGGREVRMDTVVLCWVRSRGTWALPISTVLIRVLY